VVGGGAVGGAVGGFWEVHCTRAEECVGGRRQSSTGRRPRQMKKKAIGSTAQGCGRLSVAPRRTRAVLGGQRSALGAEEHDERQSRCARRSRTH
jgi:hypothetical protein